MIWKYLYPRSLSVFGGIVMILSGVFLAVAKGFPEELGTYALIIQEMYGGMGAGALINGGLVILGIRRAIGRVNE